MGHARACTSSLITAAHLTSEPRAPSTQLARKTGLGHGGLAARVQRRSSGTEDCLRMRRLMAPAQPSPVLTPCPLPRRLTPPSMSSPGNKKILIVEDEHDILQLVKL